MLEAPRRLDRSSVPSSRSSARQSRPTCSAAWLVCASLFAGAATSGVAGGCAFEDFRGCDDAACGGADLNGGAGATAGSSGASSAAGGEANAGSDSGGSLGAGGEEAEGGSGGAGGSDVSAQCDLSKSALQETCRLTDELAVFVAPDGDDDARGTSAEPLGTLGAALEHARASNKIVAACRGAFEEPLAIAGRARVEIYGGLDCEHGWVPRAGERTLVAPAAGPGLVIEDADARVIVEGFAFQSRTPTAAGEHSIAARIARSRDVRLRDVTLAADDGADGAAGESIGFTWPMDSRDGSAARNAAGGDACSRSCPDGSVTIGGAGGDGDLDAAGNGSSARNGEPGAPPLGGGLGGVVSAECGTGAGRNGGSPDPLVAASGTGARTIGELDERGWHSAAGDPGANGGAAQGGGGGCGGVRAGGGGGGCGGCGGKGGGAGQGGGASIGLLSIDSTVWLEAVTVTAGDGGKGGDGAPGQSGELGGYGGNQWSPGGACPGGRGGAGGTGGTGGGGAGGISVGVLTLGGELQYFELQAVPGAAGDGGLGSDDIAKGAAGVSRALWFR